MYRRLPLLMALALAWSTAVSASEQRDNLSRYGSNVASRMGVLMRGGMDALKAFDGPDPYESLKAAGGVRYGEAAPAAVNGKRTNVWVIDSSYAEPRFRAKSERDDLDEWLKMRAEGKVANDTLWMLLINVSTPYAPGDRLRTLVPIGLVGDYGLFGVPDMPADVAAGLELLLLKSASPQLLEGVTGVNVTAQPQGASALATRVASLPSAPPASSSTGGSGYTAVQAAPSPAKPAAAENVNRLGPPLRGYDPKDADRVVYSGPPPLGHIPLNPGGVSIWGPFRAQPTPAPKPAAPKASLGKGFADWERREAEAKARIAANRIRNTRELQELTNYRVGLAEKQRATTLASRKAWRDKIEAQTSPQSAITNRSVIDDGDTAYIMLHNTTDAILDVRYSYSGKINGEFVSGEWLAQIMPRSVVRGVMPPFSSLKGKDWIVNKPVDVLWTVNSTTYNPSFAGTP